MDDILNLKSYETFGKFNLIGVGWVQHTKVVIYDLQELINFPDKDFASMTMKPVKILNNDDDEAIAFANVILDCGEIGKYEKFMFGEPTHSHWRLYKKAIEDYNRELSSNAGSTTKELTISEVSKIETSLDGRLWTESKILVPKSFNDIETKIQEIYHNLLVQGIDISEYSLLRQKIIPEIEDIEAGWRGVYACKISDLLNI